MVLNKGLLVISTVLCYFGFIFAACPQSEYTASQGMISSPGFNAAGKYDPNTTCTYNIRVSAGQRITLEFKNMSILGTMPNCMEDSVEIFVGCSNTTIGKFCSCSNVSMPKIYSFDNCMTLVFKSDGKNEGKGFEAQYTTANKTVRLDQNKNCSTDSVTPLHGALYTPNWPLKYPAMASCVWTFNPPPATIVRFFFTSFELDGDPICDPNRPPQTGDHISISGTDTSGKQVIIEKRLCTMPADAFFPIKDMKAIEVKFSSNSVTTNDGTGVMAGYATYIEGDLDSSSSSCTVGPSTTTSPVSTGTSSRGTSSTGTTGAKGSTTSSGGTSSGLSDTSPTGTKGSTSTGISRSAGTSSGLSVGEKAGIGVGVVLGVILLIAAGYLIWKNFFKKTTSTPEEKVFMETQP